MTTTTQESAATIAPTGVWRVDPAHSTVGFSLKHMMIATVRGRFRDFEGTLEVDEAGNARAYGTIQAASIDTGEPTRDQHLRSADFFEGDAHPEIRFETTAIEPLGDDRFRVVGELEIKGVRREVELEATVHGAGRDPWGDERVALEVRGDLNRKEFGLTWNQPLETGGVLVGDRVTLELDLSLVKEAGRAAA